MAGRREAGTRFPWQVVALVIFVRLWFWYVYQKLPAGNDWNNFYHPAAVAWVQGAPLDSSSGTPLHIFFLGLNYRLFGAGVTAMRIGQILLDGLAAACLLILGKSVFNPRAALISGLIYAFYPPAVYLSGLGQPEGMLGLCLLLMGLLWVRESRTHSGLNYFGVGFFLGVGFLLKPNYFAFFPLWFLIEILISKTRRRRTLFNMGFALVGVIAAVIPWWAFSAGRSSDWLDRAILYAKIVYCGSALRPADAGGSLMPLKLFYESQMKQLPNNLALNPAAFFSILHSTITRWSEKGWPNPGIFFSFLSNKFLQIWYATDHGAVNRWLKGLQFPFAVAGIGGIVASFGGKTGRANPWFLLLLFGYTVFALMVITPLLREMMPVMPIFILYVGYALDRLWRAWRPATQSNV